MTEEVVEAPNWMKELEARRERRLKTKLGHESGAGSPCLTCQEKCPGLDLHFWRKICKNCKCGKESHDVHDDDISGWAEFQLLGSKPNKSRKIVLPGKKEEVELEWAPKGQKEVVDKFLKDLPPELLPVKGSAAAQERKLLLQKQIPLHDIDPTLCHALTDEEVKQMNDYIDHIKDKSVGIGQIIQLSNHPVGSQFLIDRTNQQFSQGRNLAGHPSSLSGHLHKSRQAKNIDELCKNLQNLNLYYKHIDQIPEEALQEVHFGFRDILYDTNLNYDKNVLDERHLEEYFDPNKNHSILRAKRDVNNKVLPHLRRRMPNFNLQQRKLSDIPEDVLREVHFGWRDIEYDPSTHHDIIELSNLNLKPEYCKIKELKVLKAKTLYAPTEEERTPIFLGDLGNLYPYYYNNWSTLNPEIDALEHNRQYPQGLGKLPAHSGRQLQEVYPEHHQIRDLKYPHYSSNDINEQVGNPNQNYLASNKNLLPHYAPTKFTPKSIDEQSPQFNLPYDPNLLKDDMGLSNPLHLPKYSDFVKNALSKIEYPADGSTELGKVDFNSVFPPPPEIPTEYGDVMKNLSIHENNKDRNNIGSPLSSETLPPRPNLPAEYEEFIKKNPQFADNITSPIQKHGGQHLGIEKLPGSLPYGQLNTFAPIMEHGLEEANPYSNQEKGYNHQPYGSFPTQTEQIGRQHHGSIPPKNLPQNIPSNIYPYESYQNPMNVKIGSINDVIYPGLEVKDAISKEHDYFDEYPHYPPNIQNQNIVGPSPNCQKCKKPFEGDAFVINLERNNSHWHVDCFKCAGCNQPFADMIYFYDKESDNVYCGRDYAKIRGFHRCKACDELIFVKEYCLAENETFHVKHFCCFECDEPLAGKNYLVDEETCQPMCIPCYERVRANKCNTCKNVIHPHEQGANLQGVHFHADDGCFCCKICRKPLLQSKFMFRNNNLYCSNPCFQSDQ